MEEFLRRYLATLEEEDFILKCLPQRYSKPRHQKENKKWIPPEPLFLEKYKKYKDFNVSEDQDSIYMDTFCINEKYSNDRFLLYQIYDANMYPNTALSKTNNEYKLKVLAIAKEFTKNYPISIQIDDIQIKWFFNL